MKDESKLTLKELRYNYAWKMKLFPSSKQKQIIKANSDGSRFDNESLWGSKVLQGTDDFDAMAINLSKCQLVSANALHAFSIKNCPMCGRELGEDE